jgi:hypothetical protein
MIHIKSNIEHEFHYSWLSHFLFQCCTWYCILPPYNPRIGTWKMSSTFKILRYFCLFPKRAWRSWCIQCYPLFSRSKIIYSFFLDNPRVKLCPWRRLESQISNKFLHAVILFSVFEVLIICCHLMLKYSIMPMVQCQLSRIFYYIIFYLYILLCRMLFL